VEPAKNAINLSQTLWRVIEFHPINVARGING
jgi:hypothetical protein